MATGLRRAAQRVLNPTLRRIIPGQPIPETHPELLNEGELLPGVALQEVVARRKRLAESLPSGSIAVLPSARTQYMTGVIPYPYRQDADFLYFTSISQPGVAVIGDMEVHGGSFTLFVPDPHADREQWDGAKINVDAACDVFGADDAYHMSELQRKLSAMSSQSTSVFYDMAHDWSAYESQALRASLDEGRLRPLRTLTHHIRWIKSPSEVSLLQSSARVTSAALRRCMALTTPHMAEQQIAATFEYECKMNGAQRLAFPSVVASGPDACTIHYARNDKRCPADSVLLMDAGCERYGYASDVTRTWPVNGRFSAVQRDLYDIVLETHRQCLSQCRPGSTLRSIHSRSIQLLSEGLSQLKVLPGCSAQQIATGLYRRFYPHSVGHWLGIDTHDSSAVPHDRLFEPGVVLTIEPGLYIPDEPQYGVLAGIGVRIEDDVVITKDGNDVLSADVPIHPQEVEAIVRDK